jgi:hypothetical protein
MKARLFLVLLFLLLAACGPSAEEIANQIEQTVEAQPPVIQTEIAELEVTRLVEVEVTRQVEVEVTRIVEVEVERIVTATPLPTATPTATPEPGEIAAAGPEGPFAVNYAGRLESGGLVVEIGRALVARPEDTSNAERFAESEYFAGFEVVGELVISMTNTSEQTLMVYPDQGSVQIGSEQIELTTFLFGNAEFGDDLGGEIFPGVTKIGGIWFGIGRSQPSEITQMIFRFNQPRGESGSVGSDFEFVIEIPHTFEPYPEELAP